jgi:hypothetical protein
MSLNQPLLLSSALVHQVLLNPTTYPYKQVTERLAKNGVSGNFDHELAENLILQELAASNHRRDVPVA